MHIIVMPPQLIIIGMPICIMLHIASQHFMNMSFIAPSRGIISQVIPVGVMVHFIWQPIIAIPGIGIIDAAIIGFIIPPIIMGIGIICIAGFMVGLRSKSEKKLRISYSRDKMYRSKRQQWNILSVRFPPT